MKTILMLLGDSPGMYVPLMYGLAARLRNQGHRIVVAATTPYYERFTGVDCAELGDVHYLSDFLDSELNAEQLESVELDYWTIYPTYVRDNYFFGRHRNDWEKYKKVALFYQQLFGDYDIDLVVGEPPSNSFLYIGYVHTKQAGAEYIGFMSARIPSHINVFLDPYGERMLTNDSLESSAGEIADGPLNYMAAREAKFIRGNGVKQVLSFLRFSLTRSIETSSTPMLQLRAMYKKQVWRRLRYFRIRAATLFTDDFADDEKINILFPLHLRPEASTSVLSRYYEDDLELLKNIAFSLPSNARLIVKEHKPALGIRNLAFYKKVLSFPNTMLLDPGYDLAPNLRKFDAAVVLTSTAGFEASRAGLPVLLLGRTFYSNYPGITKIESFSHLEQCLRNLSKNTSKVNEEEVMRLYMPKCFPGRFNYMNDDVADEENIDKLLVPIEQLVSRLENRSIE